MASLYYGGQRVSDTVRMSRAHILGGQAQLIQQKTGKLVSVPLHQTWQNEIERVPASDQSMTLLHNRSGRPFTEDALQARWRRLRDEIGAEGYHLHGLRKNACCKLAEAHCTSFEISAITGQSLDMVEYYVKEAEKPALASHAIGLWEEHDRNESAKLSDKTAKP
ncbi:MAG: tyrosine-type recombinase/integrase [Proteobacteria bacterium]|nr:tyrosine-type recombinase/integrase [Pseudomonadota bacterium]